jgi:transglutaminase/protease-like cytokinesis protein 3
MVELAKAVQIEMVQVIGYSKGYDYKIGDSFNEVPNHAWNAVKINGRWFLLDVTWGAGYIDENNRFVRRFQDHYFLTPPESFILDHLPEDERWQLTDQPISLREFENGLFLRPAFFQYGLSVKSHYKNTLDVYDEAKVEFYTPDDVSLIAQLFQDENPLPDYLAFSQRKSGVMKIDVHIPQSGEYTLRIYAKKQDNLLKFEWVSDYRIEASGGKGKSAGFPFTYATFVNHNAYLYEPLYRYLPNGQDQKFKIFIPGAKGAAVKINDEWLFLEGQGNMFEGYIPIKKGNIQVLARFNDDSKFGALLDYIGQ